MKRRRSLKKQQAQLKLRRTVAVILSFFLMGMLWIFKENYHSGLSNRLVAAELNEKLLCNEAGRLEIEYANACNYLIISKRAEEELGMISIDQPSDTLWVASIPETDNPHLSSMITLLIGN